MDGKFLHMWPVELHNEFLCMCVLCYRKTKLLCASSWTSAKSIIRVLGIFSLYIHIYVCVPSNFNRVHARMPVFVHPVCHQNAWEVPCVCMCGCAT